METKSRFHSRTLWVNFVLAALALFVPGAQEWISSHPDVTVIIGALVNMALTLITKRALMCILLPSVLLSGCSSMQQKLELNTFYKRDILIEVNGKQYEGVTVIPRASEYDIVLEPKGDLDLVLIRSCHRQHSFEKKTKKVLFVTLGGNKFSYKYIPQQREAENVCPLRVEAYESEKGRHSWALLEFTHPNYTLDAELTCDGSRESYRGVSVCQSKAGLIQQIRFSEVVDFADPGQGCPLPVYRDGAFEWEIGAGECLYHIRNARGEMHRLVAIGYEGVLVRRGQ